MVNPHNIANDKLVAMLHSDKCIANGIYCVTVSDSHFGVASRKLCKSKYEVIRIHVRAWER